MAVSATSGGDDGWADERTVVFALHFLGGSARTWAPLVALTSERLRWVAIDLPGFGDATHLLDYRVAGMAEVVTAAVRAVAPRRWALAGHSMGAKVALAVARAAEDGAAGLENLAGLVLLAGSPPSPEPIDDDKRAEMLGWFAGDPATRRVEAEGYVHANVGLPLARQRHDAAVTDVLRIERAAWIAWLEAGSREDWAQRIGILGTPALVVAGAQDEALGPDAQTRLMLPHLAHARLVTLPAAGHLLPLEAPDALASLIVEWMEDGSTHAPEPPIDPAYLALIASDRVSARTRDVLLKRADPVVAPHGLLSLREMVTLRAVVERVIPQPGPHHIDLAARIAAALVEATGDGWRFADLPPDAEAYRAGLATLDAAARLVGAPGFADADATDQDGWLTQAAAGTLDTGEPAEGRLSAQQMKLWFEDVRADAARTYVAHPATLAILGYSGIANGGDGARKQGFFVLERGEREPWEPLALADLPR